MKQSFFLGALSIHCSICICIFSIICSICIFFKKNHHDFMSNDNHSTVSYIEILDTDTRSIEMHRIEYALVESRK